MGEKGKAKGGLKSVDGGKKQGFTGEDDPFEEPTTSGDQGEYTIVEDDDPLGVQSEVPGTSTAAPDNGKQATMAIIQPSDKLRQECRRVLGTRRMSQELVAMRKALMQNVEILMAAEGLTFCEVDGVPFTRKTSSKVEIEKFAEWTPPDGTDYAAECLHALGMSPSDLTSKPDEK